MLDSTYEEAKGPLIARFNDRDDVYRCFDLMAGGIAAVIVLILPWVPSILSHDRPDELLVLDESLSRLAALDPRQAQVVELRFFAGLTVEETAAALAISPASVKRESAARTRAITAV